MRLLAPIVAGILSFKWESQVRIFMIHCRLFNVTPWSEQFYFISPLYLMTMALLAGDSFYRTFKYGFKL